MLSLLAEVRRRAGDAGLNLLGLVDAERFDAAQTRERRVRSIAPDCGTVLVVGSGGRELWQRFERRSGASCRSAARVDRYASAAARQIETLLRSSAIRCRTIAGPCDSRLPFTQLGEAAGLGTVSPVTGLLLHPQFGPWVRIRAVVLADGRPFGPIADASISERFQPCCGCSRPCVTACPVGVHDGLGGQDFGRCASHRHAGNCETHCSSRSACPVGSSHRDADGEHAHRHAHSLSALRRHFGLGVWRWLPNSWRRP
ncbi:MAG: hypothetical protein JNM25_02540 [Planctomycetes bacterium]|nr:hypothetical protein [Planctomycetota bacterium]